MLTPKLRIGGGLRLRPQPEPAEAPPVEPAKQIDEVLRKFREQAKSSVQQFVDNTDSEFWIAIGFQNRAQKEEFLRLSGLIALGDKYLDGVEVARLLDIPLKVEKLPTPKFRGNKRLVGLAVGLTDEYPRGE